MEETGGSAWRGTGGAGGASQEGILDGLGLE